ncbi:hypothetical protein M422DRAFT_256140 [Sphaerobolus stellatus SS14]|uniref:N-acetyltransferase domain-containing protein n=1 Tax=Sphaerobolus stellatus (strain SS14) TaxID=990650 RepID=A0A0C9VHT2_SPHS4|nr:hypothetical protein M422DRAFT_256140 [Sphaerobolus stellatus SS14]
MDLSIKEVRTRKTKYFDGAIQALAEAFETDADFVTGGNPSLFKEVITAYLGMGISEGHVDVAVINHEVVGVICWLEPGKEIKPMKDPGYAAFWEKLCPQTKKWYMEDAGPNMQTLRNEGFKLPAGCLDRYAIEILGVKPKNRGKGIGGMLIRQCIDAAKREIRPEAAMACVISTDIAMSAYRAQGMELRATKHIPRSPWSTEGYDRHAMVYSKFNVDMLHI